MDEETKLFKRRWETSEEIRDGMNTVIQKQIAEIGRLRSAHEEIVRKYEKIMGEPPDWTTFNGDDQRLKFAREAWFGAAEVSRKALNG